MTVTSDFDDARVWLTVDVVLFAAVKGRPHVLLIRRADDSDAYPSRWALPGGYVDAGERIDAAARRELAEETGLTAPAWWQRVGIYDDPSRDPRDRVVSIAYAAALPHPVTARAGSDATAAIWFPVAGALAGQLGVLAFDHVRIVADAASLLAAVALAQDELPAPAANEPKEG